MKKVWVGIFVAVLFIWLWGLQHFWLLGFPVVWPIQAKCLGYKFEKADKLGINRIYCYGVMYDYWLE